MRWDVEFRSTADALLGTQPLIRGNRFKCKWNSLVHFMPATTAKIHVKDRTGRIRLSYESPTPFPQVAGASAPPPPAPTIARETIVDEVINDVAPDSGED